MSQTGVKLLLRTFSLAAGKNRSLVRNTQPSYKQFLFYLPDHIVLLFMETVFVLSIVTPLNIVMTLYCILGGYSHVLRTEIRRQNNNNY